MMALKTFITEKYQNQVGHPLSPQTHHCSLLCVRASLQSMVPCLAWGSAASLCGAWLHSSQLHR